MKKSDYDINYGLLLALNLVREHDDAVIAKDIVNTYSSLKELKDCAKKMGSETEMDTIRYLDAIYEKDW